MRVFRAIALFAVLAVASASAALAQDDTTETRPPARVPHPTANREDCLNCHAVGNTRGVKTVPAEHSYASTRCARCHRPAEQMPPGSRHAFDADHTDCTHCHVAGNTVNAKPTPEGHSRFTATMCAMCHEQNQQAPPGSN